MAEKRRGTIDRLAPALLVALVAVHAFLAFDAARRASVTIDEFAHLPAGLTYWQQGTFALYHHNPPLAKLLAALPVLASHPEVDYTRSWATARMEGRPPNPTDFGTDFMRANAARYIALFMRGRAAIIALSAAGLVLVYQWARALWGTPSGLLAAVLWAYEPNLIAHAGLVTTDVAATVLILAATWAFWRWLERHSLRRATLAGVLFGLALLTKFTALLLFPVFAVMAAVYWPLGPRPGPPAPPPKGRLSPVLSGLPIPVLALLVLNLGYGFEGTGRVLGSFPFLSTTLTRPRTGGEVPRTPYAFYRMIYEQRQNRFEGTWLGALPVPVPEQYLLGLDEQRFEANTGLPGGGYAVSLRGEVRRSGWWWYYLYALAVKTPIGLWFIVGLSIGVAILRRQVRLGRDEIVLALPALAVVLAMSLMTGLDVGVRYVLPIFPFLFLGAARVMRPDVRRILGRPGRFMLLAGFAWIAFGTLAIHPHELSYFNELAGGPAGGHRELLDSNLDWGQDLPSLRRWLEEERVTEPIDLAYFGNVDPALYGIRYTVPPRDPRIVPKRRRVPSDALPLHAGVYAVSVNFVEGLPLRVVAPDGSGIAVEEDAFGYFRALRPAARAGWSIWIFRLSEEDAARLNAMLSGGRRD
jgi:4-amino-4-deoxy-L-arabinose transferase-like glycosyltransferase